ncbi:acyltransferase [Ancylostoma ceylanicum]|uniref:Acyltransferase n=1 Tax=Ancylostoma ceylanicum TaxID=53326 RepID=A0A0D6MAZ3_9BILA|nr:acyltransferase [Ancylostoma ceylanicum]
MDAGGRRSRATTEEAETYESTKYCPTRIVIRVFGPLRMSEKRLDIQGLRGWAIVLVVLFHFFPDYFPNGYIGVDMFFVISGFLIAMILRQSDTLDMEAIRSFYYRRIRRILPLYYLAIACILIALFLLLPSSYRSMNIDSSRRAIILISNIKKVDVDANYQKLLLNAEDLFTHTWSLCVEMQWYLLVPLIFVAQRFATAWEKTFFTGVAISSIVFYFLIDDVNSFYCVLARIWQFCFGVLAELMQNEGPALSLPQYEKIALLDAETFEDEAQILGLVCSILLAVAAYHLFEKYYLTWPPQGVLSMLAVLAWICAILALQPHSVDEEMFGKGPVNYSAINPNDAAWNMTLMRYLNYKENAVWPNLQLKGCAYTEKFVEARRRPYGFCSMKDGTGKYDFLVLGNSFTCNQGCEVMTWSSAKICQKRVNYTAMFHELRPDVVFVISRALAAKHPFNTSQPLDEDRIFQKQLRRLIEIEGIAKKLYLLQALPSCHESCSSEAQDFMRHGRALNELKDGLIEKDDFFARERINELRRR